MTTIDWSTLSFSYNETPVRFQAVWENGSWNTGELTNDPMVHIHEASTVLNYGQTCFEGLKAQRSSSGDILLFRPDLNIERMQQSARRLYIPEVPADLYMKGLEAVIKANAEFIPPYGTGASLYIRPLLMGVGPMIGVTSAEQFIFRIYVSPVGAYYSKGKITPITLAVSDYDRAAPAGTGNVKAGGNYAGGILATKKAQENGANEALYLDPSKREYLEEAGTANLVIVTKDGKLITPQSPSILPSVTRRSLTTIAQDLGITVEERPIHFRNEVATFEEMAICGTAAVLTPVGKIIDGNESFSIGNHESFGPTLQRLYDHLTKLQVGDVNDPHGWIIKV